MKRAKTNSFILELPISVTPKDEHTLLARFEAGRKLYNAVLGGSLIRQKRMREPKAWQAARAIPIPAGKEGKAVHQERSLTFHAVCDEYRFTSADLSSFDTHCKNSANYDDRLGAHETQKIAERAFFAAEQYGYGKRGRPRFKGKSRPLHSIGSKTNAAGIRWKAATGHVEWHNLTLPAIIAPEGKDAWQTEALARNTKYCRALWRNLNGKRRWYVHLIQEGTSPRRHAGVAHGTVGLDIGPSTVAIMSNATGELVQFCPSIKQPWKTIRTLQRKLDRSRRATNPVCYNTDGTWKKRKRQTVFSKKYGKTLTLIAEAERKLTAERKRSHGELANTIISHGNIIKAEKLSYRSFQKNFGRSAKVTAPASFIKTLTRKAESAGGLFVSLDTKGLKLSQYDHITWEYVKKPLSQRWHVLENNGTLVQRDT